MFTAKIINKEVVKDRLVLGVEFTNGTKTVVENVTPQDEVAFKRWVQSRNEALESLVVLDKNFKVNDEVDPAISEPELSQAEKDKQIWIRKVSRIDNIQRSLVDTGVFTGLEQPIVDLRDDIKATYKPAYINEL